MAANYVSSTSDKSKKVALIFWLVGLLGIMGLENFYVGKIKKGAIHAFLGLLLGMAAITGILEEGVEFLFAFALIWVIFALPNLIKLLMGVFRDNVGNPLRK